MQFDPGMEYRPDWVEANGKFIFLITQTQIQIQMKIQNTNTNMNILELRPIKIASSNTTNNIDAKKVH